MRAFASVVDGTAVDAAASGSTLGLEQSILAKSGQPALTILAVGFTNTGKVQGVSLGDGNVIEVYASGPDFNDGNVLYREFMSLGEPVCFTGLANGAIITSTQGFYGMSEVINGNSESPMPLLSYGLSFTETFFFAFRNSQNFNTGALVNNAGSVFVVNGPLDNKIKLTFGDGSVVQGQEDIRLGPWEYIALGTNGNVEYILSGTNPMMACKSADETVLDARLIMPLTADGVGWAANGNMSAPYANTRVQWYTRDGVRSTAGTALTISPGSPVNIAAATGTTDADYEPNGVCRFRATGLVSAYSGADSSGGEATPMIPVFAMSQVVAQPFFIDDVGDGGNSGIAIASPYEGTARVYSWDDSTGGLVLEYTVSLVRSGVTVTSKEDQYHPAAGLIANDGVATNTLTGDLNAGVVIADVPIVVIAQNGTQSFVPTVRSQNGTTTTSLRSDDDETLMLGWTPDTLRADIVEGGDGILYKRVINGGAETWEVA